jgi:hypothetical protein
MQTRSLFGILALVVAVSLAGGCATPIEKGDATPKLARGAEAKVAVSVIEARTYVLSGEKTTKFEGIFRGAFGIPHSINRPNRPADERFVDYLAEMLKDGLAGAGHDATVVKLPENASLDSAWTKLAETGAGQFIVIRVLESNWDAGGISGNFVYKYEFDLRLAGRGGPAWRGKTFVAREVNPASGTYNVFDMHTVRYKAIMESMFADPEIRSLLQ